MAKYPEKKIEKFIINKINLIEKYAKKAIINEEFDNFDDERVTLLPITGIKFGKLEFKKPIKDYKDFTKSNIYEIKFDLSYNGIKYTFETSNYYFYEQGNEFYELDIFENISVIINRFEFLLENENDLLYYNHENEDDDFEEDGYGVDFYIDDDDNWQWIDREYTDIEYFLDHLSIENGYYVYDNGDDHGKFYWEEE